MMQRYTTLICLVFLSTGAYSFDQYFKFNVIGGLGWTAGDKVNVGDGSLINYSGGVQGLYHLTRYFSVGLETRFSHQYSSKYTQDSHPDARSPYKHVRYANTSAVIELWFVRHLIVLQITAGPYIGVADNRDVGGGFSLNFGAVVPIDDYFGVIAMQRIEFIFSGKTLVPLTFHVGINIRL